MGGKLTIWVIISLPEPITGKCAEAHAKFVSDDELIRWNGEIMPLPIR